MGLRECVCGTDLQLWARGRYWVGHRQPDSGRMNSRSVCGTEETRYGWSGGRLQQASVMQRDVEKENC